MVAMHVTFTLDLEDHRPSPDAPERYPALTRQVLDFLDAREVRGTFFVVGETARGPPRARRARSRRAATRSGLHGWRHQPLTELDRRRVPRRRAPGQGPARGARRCVRCVGFRAPTFSLVPESRWAVDVLADTGFTYSSSVLPARSPLFGDPTLPTTPFRWPNGLVELPCPVVRAGGRRAPLPRRRLPARHPGAASTTARRSVGRGQLLWIYCHPYDFDPDEEFWVVPDAGRLGQPAALVQPAAHVRQGRERAPGPGRSSARRTSARGDRHADV